MMNKKAGRQRSLFLVLIVLVFASLACNLPGAGAPNAEVPQIPVSTEAVQDLETQVQQAAATAQSGQATTVTIDESQITSLVAFELQKQPEPILRDPQVLLRDGQVQLLGNVSQSGMELPLKMALNVSADADGRPQYEVTSANLGPLPMPDSLLNQATAQIDAAIGGELASVTNDMFIENITIADGLMTITGRLR